MQKSAAQELRDSLLPAEPIAKVWLGQLTSISLVLRAPVKPPEIVEVADPTEYGALGTKELFGSGSLTIQ